MIATSPARGWGWISHPAQIDQDRRRPGTQQRLDQVRAHHRIAARIVAHVILVGDRMLRIQPAMHHDLLECSRFVAKASRRQRDRRRSFGEIDTLQDGLLPGQPVYLPDAQAAAQADQEQAGQQRRKQAAQSPRRSGYSCTAGPAPHQ